MEKACVGISLEQACSVALYLIDTFMQYIHTYKDMPRMEVKVDQHNSMVGQLWSVVIYSQAS